jgi:hypothetical protein
VETGVVVRVEAVSCDIDSQSGAVFLMPESEGIVSASRETSERMLWEAAERAHPGDPARQILFMRRLVDDLWKKMLAGREIAMGVAWERKDQH